MVALQIAMLWLALVAPAVVADPWTDFPEARQVIVAELEVLIEPSDSAYATQSLHSADRVVVIGEEHGWARIRAPAGTFAWINAATLDERADGVTVVGSAPAQIRFAGDRAALPGPPDRLLPPGTPVRLLDRSDLTVRGRTAKETWRAIEVDPGEVRFVESAGLQRLGPAQNLSAGHPDRSLQLASYAADRGEADLPPEVNAEIASIAVMNRSIKASPVETWEIGPVKARYEALIRRYHDNSLVLAVVQPRLDRAVRDELLARKALDLSRLLNASEQRDTEVSRIHRSVDQARAATDRQFDAQGLLQPSSRRYRGQKVLALIGPEGRPICYLTFPPGVPINQYLARKVGIRGIVHFDEGLGSRLISVRDLELLEKIR